MLLMTSSRTSSVMVEKIQNGRFIAIFRILRQEFDLEKFFMYPSHICYAMHVTSDQFSDKLNNG